MNSLFMICSCIHLNVFSIPIFNGCDGFQSNFSFSNLLSEFLPRTPNGHSICLIVNFLFAISITISASLLIETISSEPMLTGP